MRSTGARPPGGRTSLPTLTAAILLGGLLVAMALPSPAVAADDMAKGAAIGAGVGLITGRGSGMARGALVGAGVGALHEEGKGKSEKYAKKGAAVGAGVGLLSGGVSGAAKGAIYTGAAGAVYGGVKDKKKNDP